MTDRRDRRDVLRAGVALCSVGLAGCLGGGGGGDDGNGTSDGGNSTNGTGPDDEEPEPVTAWPQQQYDAQNTAAVPNADPPILDLEELWRVDLGERVRSSPVVAEDGIYVRDLSGTVHALDAEGSDRWTASVPEGELLTTPAIYEELLLVPHDSGLIAFDRSDGEEQWQYSSEHGTTDLTVADDAVFFSDTHRSVHAVDALTGEPRWQVTGNPREGQYSEPPAVHDGEVIVPKSRGFESEVREITAIDVETGGKYPLFRTSEYDFSAGISIADGKLFAPTPGGVRAYDRGGTELWHFPTEKPIEAGLAVGEERVFVITSGEEFSGTLYGIDFTQGTDQWSVDDRIGPSTGPVVMGDTVAFGGIQGQFIGIYRSNGADAWRTAAPYTFFDQCSFADGQYYLAGADGTLLAHGKQ